MAKKIKLAKKRSATKKKFVAIAIAATAIASAAGWWTLKSGRNVFQVPTYQAERIVDGDTFVTKENQMIRIASIDAPEIGRCGSQEAKRELERLIMGKPMYLKVFYRDKSNRLISDVYNEKGLISEQLLNTGWFYYHGISQAPKKLKVASDKAKEKEIGIYSSLCTQDRNPKDSSCVIKGNINVIYKTEKTYHFPGCSSYNTTVVQLFMGDQWFCTEAEAKKAGFIKGTDCFDKNWPTSEVVHKI